MNCKTNGFLFICLTLSTGVQTLCSGMISLSVIFLPFVGSIISFLIIFSMHSIVTTFPLQKNDTSIKNAHIQLQQKGICLLMCTCMLNWTLVITPNYSKNACYMFKPSSGVCNPVYCGPVPSPSKLRGLWQDRIVEFNVQLDTLGYFRDGFTGHMTKPTVS